MYAGESWIFFTTGQKQFFPSFSMEENGLADVGRKIVDKIWTSMNWATTNVGTLPDSEMEKSQHGVGKRARGPF